MYFSIASREMRRLGERCSSGGRGSRVLMLSGSIDGSARVGDTLPRDWRPRAPDGPSRCITDASALESAWITTIRCSWWSVSGVSRGGSSSSSSCGGRSGDGGSGDDDSFRSDGNGWSILMAISYQEDRWYVRVTMSDVILSRVCQEENDTHAQNDSASLVFHQDASSIESMQNVSGREVRRRSSPGKGLSVGGSS